MYIILYKALLNRQAFNTFSYNVLIKERCRKECMIIVNFKINQDTILKIINLYFASFPIFNSYHLGNRIPVTIVFGIILIIILLFLKKEIRIRNIYIHRCLPILYIVCGFSITSSLTYNASISLYNSIFMFTLQFLIVICLMSYADFQLFSKYYVNIAKFAIVVAILQVVQQTLNMNVFSGKLPFFYVIDDKNWMATTYGFRFNSLFSEPSYFAIFLGPCLIQSASKNNLKLFAFTFIGLILSSSSMGFMLIGISISYYFLINDKKHTLKNKLMFIFGIFIFLVLFYFIVNNTPNLYSIVYRTFNKLNTVIEDSQLRISGNLEYFSNVDIINRFIGVGIAQLSNYLFTIGIYTSNYSNGFIIMLFNYGIIGALLLIILFSSWFKIKDKIPYVFMFFSVLTFDTLLFNGLFYLFLFMIFIENNKEKNQL